MGGRNKKSAEVSKVADDIMCNNTRSSQVDRDPSPMPNIHKALMFKYEVNHVNKPPKKRSSRPSLEDDLKKVSSSPLLGSDIHNKENLPDISLLKVRKLSSQNNDSKRTGLSPRDGETVFRFSSSQFSPQFSKPPSANTRVPRISVMQCEDDVFDPSYTPLSVPESSKLVLTPSTAHTPRFRYSSSSSLYSSSFVPSPSIEQGMLCNTPNRIQLEKEGLSTKKFVLGKGAYGTVVLGQYRGRKVAVKVMEKEEGGAKNSKRRKSLESELKAMELDHENIVRVYGVHAADDRHAVIIMEYVGSRNLHRLLVELREKSLGSSWLLLAAKQVSSALAYCHRKGVLHMDVKPANVMVTSQGVCKLGDFGCSVSTNTSSLAVDHSLVGTPGYQAPEFLRGKTPTPACDVYSLAILMWQLDAREVPFSGQHPQTVMFRVVSAGVRPSPPVSHMACISSHVFTALYKSCWDSNPASRPSARQVVDALNNIYKSKTERNSLKLRSMR